MDGGCVGPRSRSRRSWVRLTLPPPAAGVNSFLGEVGDGVQGGGGGFMGALQEDHVYVGTWMNG